VPKTLSMKRFTLMSRLGLAEPVVRFARAVEKSNRAAAAQAREHARTKPHAA
jgi:hypothetical protein